MPRFEADSQFGDFNGEVAADLNANVTSFSGLLRDERLISENEFVVGLSFFIGASGTMQLLARVAPADGVEATKAWLKKQKEPIPLRRVEVEWTMEKFFSKFSRFSLVMEHADIGVVGKEIQ